MNKFSFGRIALLLSTISIPVNILLLIGIMIGGGFASDTRGFIFWILVVVTIVSWILVPISWKNKEKGGAIPVITLIICLIPTITTIALVH